MSLEDPQKKLFSNDDPRSNKLIWTAALGLTLPMILASGPVAGYCIGWFFKKNFGASDIWIPVLSCLGMAGSGIQVFHLIQKLNRSKPKENDNESSGA